MRTASPCRRHTSSYMPTACVFLQGLVLLAPAVDITKAWWDLLPTVSDSSTFPHFGHHKHLYRAWCCWRRRWTSRRCGGTRCRQRNKMTRVQLAMCPSAATPRWKPGNAACQFYCAHHQVTALGGEVNTGLDGWRSRLNFGMSKQRCSSFEALHV